MTRIESCLRTRVNSLSGFYLLIVGICVCGTLMAFAPLAAGQMTEKVLHDFAGNSNGAVSNLIRDDAGNLYGTTQVGGSGYAAGMVFKVDPTGTETILYSFSGNPIQYSDGAQPMAGLIMDQAGNLYGTTAGGGGPHGAGTIFKVDQAGNLTNLYIYYNTSSQNGASPQAGLIMDSAGNLYGTTYGGGNNGFGTIFKLDPTGKLTVLYNFMGTAGDGANPRAGLVRDSAGNLYGTTLNGGTAGVGTVFKVDSTGLETVLHSFTGANGDGANPQATLIQDSAGNLYGTTLNGGTAGVGTVFKVDSTGLETVLHSFTGTDSTGTIVDGANPEAGLIRDSAGNLYGTTVHGGTTGNGTIFKLDSTNHETVLYRFTGADGSQPQASLVQDSAGTLYGTTWLGGASQGGTIFSLNSTGTETVLFSFAGLNGDGVFPQAGLIQDSAGNLYGTTYSGGTTVGNCSMCGTVYKVDPTGKESVIYYFTATGDGANPAADLIRDSAGNLYGTTYYGGTSSAGPSSGFGTVFKLDAAGHETVLHNFTRANGDGSNPQAGLVQDSKGNLYGTTVIGGVNGWGTVFKLDPTGKETVLYSFTGRGTDGQYPEAGLVQDSKGNLYGTTYQSGIGSGMAFKLNRAGTLTVLHSFPATSGDGQYLKAGLIRDSAGNLYGTTDSGGVNGAGTVFKIDPAGKETVLYNFKGQTNGDGSNPQAALVMDSAGNLYGTTNTGGVNGWGTVFKLDPTGKETVLHSFTAVNGDGANPQAGLVRDSAGNLYGTTSGGGTLNKGIIFELVP